MLRPPLPRKLKQGRAGSQPARSWAGFWGWLSVIWFPLLSTKLGGAKSQFAFQNARSGAVGTWKHPVLTYALGCPGFVSVLHPAPPNRLGKAQSSLLRVFWGSDPVPHVGVNGIPSLAVKISPISHPPKAHWAGAERDLGVGSSQVPFITSVRPTLKSERARLNLKSNHERLEIELPKVSPATDAELVSMLLDQVKVPCT